MLKISTTNDEMKMLLDTHCVELIWDIIINILIEGYSLNNNQLCI
jgi:hypothetical protein